MWPFKKKKLKLYTIKWKYLEYDTFSPGTDVVEAENLAKAWKKVCRIHSAYQIGMIGWTEVECA